MACSPAHQHVVAACERGAVETLLVTDALFRADEEATRRAYVKLVEDAKAQGADVHVFSSLHVSGEALQQVGVGSVACVTTRLSVCVTSRLSVCDTGDVRACGTDHGCRGCASVPSP